MKLNKNTSKAKQFIERYNTSSYQSIYDLYNSVSIDKRMNEKRIYYIMKLIGGYDYKVLGGNMYVFTCAYKCKENKKEKLIVYTKDNVYEIEL